MIALAEEFGAPTIGDGAAMWRMATAVGLDRNSAYKYLVFCRDFADTSAVARDDGDLVGFVTGYRRPSSPDTLFVWQIGVLGSHRRRGIGVAMLDHLRGRLASSGVRFVEASVTPSNSASQRLFRSFASAARTRCEESELFTAEVFPEPHEAERLLRIGPLDDAPLSTEKGYAVCS